MGTLIRFELKKMLGGRFFPIALGLLLAVNILLNCGIPNYLLVREAVVSGTALGSETPETFTYWSYTAGNRQITAGKAERYGALSRLTAEEEAAFVAAMEEKYGEDAFVPFRPDWPEEALQPSGYFEGLPDSVVITAYRDLLDMDQQIEEARADVIPAAQRFGREALEDGDNYGIRRNLDIIRLYSEPQARAAADVVGWNTFLLETPSTMLLVCLLLLLACAGSVSGENDRQTWLLLHTARYGKGRTLAAKYIAGAVTAVGLTVLFQLAALGAVWFYGGLLGAAGPVTAIVELRLFPYVMTVWQYALLALACQAFAAVALSVLLTTVSALSPTGVVSYAAGTVLLGGCLLLAYFPPRAELLSGPLALSVPLRYFDTYYTADLFGFPVLWALVQAALWCLLGVGCVVLAHRTYHRKRGAV
mgnify:FL=1